VIVPYLHLAIGQGFLSLGALPEMLATFTRSDVAPGAVDPFWYRWATVQGTHALFGVVLALRWPRWAGWAFTLWAAKEAAFDIPNGGGAVFVALDSLADLGAGALGFAFGRTYICHVHRQPC